MLAELGADVTTIERHEALATTARQGLQEAGYGDRVKVVVGDGTQGWAESASVSVDPGDGRRSIGARAAA